MLSPETINSILLDYQNPNIKMADILNKYNVGWGTVYNLIKKYNVPNRRPNGTASKMTKKKKCQNCKRTVQIKEARFCPYCGADLRSEKDFLIEKTEDLFGMCMFLPENQRDNAQKIIKEICDYLKKEV